MNYIGGILKVELDLQNLHIIIQALNGCQIKGEDAILFSKLLEKLTKAFEKEQAKEQAKDGNV